MVLSAKRACCWVTVKADFRKNMFQLFWISMLVSLCNSSIPGDVVSSSELAAVFWYLFVYLIRRVIATRIFRLPSYGQPQCIGLWDNELDFTRVLTISSYQYAHNVRVELVPACLERTTYYKNGWRPWIARLRCWNASHGFAISNSYSCSLGHSNLDA